MSDLALRASAPFLVVGGLRGRTRACHPIVFPGG